MEVFIFNIARQVADLKFSHILDLVLQQSVCISSIATGALGVNCRSRSARSTPVFCLLFHPWSVLMLLHRL